MTKANSVFRYAAAIIWTALLVGCNVPNQQTSTSAYREEGWTNGNPLIHWSMLDAVEQALSLSINSDDLHSHQIDLRKKRGQTLNAQSNLSGVTLCKEEQKQKNWADMECTAFDTRMNTSTQKTDLCKFKHCTEIRFAPFIVKSTHLMNVVNAAVTNPCAYIPDFKKLQIRHASNEPRGGRTMHTSNVSQHWLFCDADKPVKGHLIEVPNSNTYVIQWDRS